MHCRKKQPIRKKQPKEKYYHKYNGKQTYLAWRNGQQIADQIAIVFRKATATERCYKNTESNCCTGKYADDGVSGVVGTASHKAKQHGKCHSEHNGHPGGVCQTTDTADSNTGKSGVTQGIGEEAHFAGNDHRRTDTKQRSHDQHRQQGIFHKIHGHPLERQQIQKGIPKTHALPPPS